LAYLASLEDNASFQKEKAGENKYGGLEAAVYASQQPYVFR
jgi:hypothetical protein